MGMEAVERTELATKLEICQFDHDDDIIVQSDMADSMFIMESGSALVFVGETNVHEYHEGDYFGEPGLILEEPRAATVKACGKVSCWKLGRAAFEQVAGSCGPELMERSKQYVFSLFRTRITTCYAHRAETGPFFVPG